MSSAAAVIYDCLNSADRVKHWATRLSRLSDRSRCPELIEVHLMSLFCSAFIEDFEVVTGRIIVQLDADSDAVGVTAHSTPMRYAISFVQPPVYNCRLTVAALASLPRSTNEVVFATADQRGKICVKRGADARAQLPRHNSRRNFVLLLYKKNRRCSVL